MGEIKNESFIRWQARSIEQLGNGISLLIGIAIASLGFVISQVAKEEFHFKTCLAKLLLSVGSGLLLLCIILLLILSYKRILGFKITARIARKRETGKRTGIDTDRKIAKQIDATTWALFAISIWVFAFGEVMVIVGFICQILEKF
jgi:hypothetical protein